VHQSRCKVEDVLFCAVQTIAYSSHASDVCYKLAMNDVLLSAAEKCCHSVIEVNKNKYVGSRQHSVVEFFDDCRQKLVLHGDTGTDCNITVA